MALEQKTVLIDGLAVSYLEAGEDNGRTVVLIHGGIGDARLHWEPVMQLLAMEDFRVLAPDLPGFGQSQPLPVMRTDTLLHWLKSFLDRLGVQQTAVIGNSLGGLVARLFAAANPQLVPAVILLNGGGVPEIPPALRVLERIPILFNFLLNQFVGSVTSPDNLRRMIHAPDVLTDDFIARSRAARGSFTRLMRMLVSGTLPEARTPLVPTLILWGANDNFTPLADGEAVRDSIPGSTLTPVTDCGNMPQLETPDVFVWQVSNFLQKLTRPQRSDLPGAGILPDLPTG
ncbi:MAG: alpha/beta hydrolase [Chloroflexi bacterium]|nr:alpha/beta hydrolase [Chloroflexota bacterium]